jgi:hypothetical protein
MVTDGELDQVDVIGVVAGTLVKARVPPSGAMMVDTDMQRVMDEVARTLDLAYATVFGPTTATRLRPGESSSGEEHEESSSQDDDEVCSIISEMQHLPSVQKSIREELDEAEDSYRQFSPITDYGDAPRVAAFDLAALDSRSLVDKGVGDDSSVATALTVDVTLDTASAHSSTSSHDNEISERTRRMQRYSFLQREATLPLMYQTRDCLSGVEQRDLGTTGPAFLAGRRSLPTANIAATIFHGHDANTIGGSNVIALCQLAMPLFVISNLVCANDIVADGPSQVEPQT